jgi:hypothetical protein
VLHFDLFISSTHLRSQAQSVMSAKDRYLQRKAGATPATLALKKDRIIDSSVASPAVAGIGGCSAHVKQEPQGSFGSVAIKRE